ncbi:paired amphipathic helix protein Sin3a-like [Styela clava]
MSNQFDKKDEPGVKPSPPGSQHSQHALYARRQTPGILHGQQTLVSLVHGPNASTYRDTTAERPIIPNSTSVAISTTRFGVPSYNRPPTLSQQATISQPLCLPLQPQAVMQQPSESLSQQHHMPHQAPILHHPVIASGLLGHLSLPQLPASSQAQIQAQQQQQQSQFQRLKVEDALSYLDQVKFQFGNQPQVYNDFLDIMKEFKSQSIDTPGVIQRVSSLFAGHADLIVGFNTFLPPGYKIEVSGNDQVSVTGPNMLPQTINTQHGGAGPPNAVQVHAPQTKYVTPPVTGPTSQNQQPLIKSQSGHALTPPSSMFTPNAHSSQANLTSSSAASVNASTLASSKACAGPLVNSITALGSSIPPPPVGQQPQVGSQPVEFNHAINYVNKIKHRFQGQTDIYKAFLEILHKYQKEQRTVKETNGAYTPMLSESEVYAQVAKLFKNDEDLLREFGQFLPDAGGGISGGNLSALTGGVVGSKSDGLLSEHLPAPKKHTQLSSSSANSTGSSGSAKPRMGHHGLKRSSSISMQGKKVRSCSLKDVSLAEASKHGTLGEFGFFDKVRRALGTQEVYDNFLRCLLLFNNEVIGRAELVQLAQPFLVKFPELFGWFKRFLGYKEGQTGENWSSLTGLALPQQPIAQAKEKHEGMAMEIDYTTLKRLGSSYRALPTSYEQPRCTGRDVLCKEVLNDTWVSFPSWSEDSQSVTSKKTQFEEHVYRCEDERFELDVVLETNLATILVLEAVNKDLSRMNEEEKSKFKLDNCLGGTSEVIHRKAIHRIYGDKAPDIIDGLKKNAAVAVPVVLKRLKLKDEEWREAQHQFNKVWREQNEKYYLKSLDHQGINFKQNDTRYLRSKSLLNEIENLFDERQEALENGANPATLQGPLMTLTYEDKSMMDDCASLIIHHVKRQSSIHKDDKQKMKVFMYQTLPDLFFSPRGNQPSDDDDEDYDSDTKSTSSRNGKNGKSTAKPEIRNTGAYSANDDLDGLYHMFMCNNPFYLFFRLHEILCSRLLKIYRHAEVLAEEDAKGKKESDGKESIADMLRLKQVSDIEVEDYYPAFLEMVRNLLDGNIEPLQFEDQLRDMFTIHAYTTFTMDRLVQNIVRQLHHIVQDEQCSQLLEYYNEEEKNNATGGEIISKSRRAQPEAAYQRRSEQLLIEENCYKMTILQKKSQFQVEIQLLDTDEDQDESAELADSAKWSDYVEHYVNDLEDDMPDVLKKKILKIPPVFMQRNARIYRQQKRQYNEENFEEDKTNSSDKQIRSNSDKRPRSRLYFSEDMEVKFVRNSYKMIFVPGTEYILYRENALKSAKERHDTRNKRLHDKFQSKVTEWGCENVSRDMSRQCTNWLMGRSSSTQGNLLENLVNCTTVCKVEKVGLLSRNLYKVEYHTEGKTQPTN